MLVHRVRFISLLITVTILVTLLLGCTVEKQESKLKVALLHFGDIGDYGWTYEAHLGAQQAAESLPYVELSEREDACSSKTPEIMKEYVEAGHKVIFCHSWDFGKYIEEVAPEYPDVIFMWGGGVGEKTPNTGLYFGRMYEGRYLCGMVAGAMTKTDKIGYAAATPIPEVIRGIDAFARGVASVNPEAEVHVEWINEWYAPAKEKGVTSSLIDKGCDVITNHSDSYAPAEAAEERGVYFISYHSDIREFAPHASLTGVVWNWGPIMTDIIEAVHDGTWSQHPNQDWWYGLADGGVKLAPFSNTVPENVRNMIEERKQMIISGEFEIFPGMSDNELREIDYFEQNVVGEIP
jgi:basic membrane protein A